MLGLVCHMIGDFFLSIQQNTIWLRLLKMHIKLMLNFFVLLLSNLCIAVLSSEPMGFWIATQLKTCLSIFRSVLFDCPFWKCKLNGCLIFFLFVLLLSSLCMNDYLWTFTRRGFGLPHYWKLLVNILNCFLIAHIRCQICLFYCCKFL